ncbi:hypothetical protein NPIL_418421 [Nephila pilipes]|uniref:Uncharacterized protein n=1 Tax=Nephila pilipes TaxID=299642 RepID=A0A8X6JNP8_NEPPI|nr:hypothetical protein NPIL_418421 [Nephila pilipes]
MECNNSRPSSPSLTQDKETCETLRLMNERLTILKMQHEDAYSHVCHIESRYMDRKSDFYKGAYGLYLTAKEAVEEAEDILECYKEYPRGIPSRDERNSSPSPDEICGKQYKLEVEIERAGNEFKIPSAQEACRYDSEKEH